MGTKPAFIIGVAIVLAGLLHAAIPHFLSKSAPATEPREVLLEHGILTVKGPEDNKMQFQGRMLVTIRPDLVTVKIVEQDGKVGVTYFVPRDRLLSLSSIGEPK